MKSNNARMVTYVLQHMYDHSMQLQHGGILFHGDPGIGKTTFIQQIAQLLGLSLITIEIPHVVEEQLINIPFVLYNAKTQTTEEKSISTYDIHLAESKLYSDMIQSGTKIDDDHYIEYMLSCPKYVQNLFQELGGDLNENIIPSNIQNVRDRFSIILFLDEYYRETTIRVRNILRGILNNNIGLHKIPSFVYPIYASNMFDSGLDSIPQNNQFNVVQFKTPTVQEWKCWFKAKHGKKPWFKKDIFDAFITQIITTNDLLSFNDKDIRVSPRRWEQMIIHTMQSFPIETAKQCRNLMSYLHLQFVHYETGDCLKDLSKKTRTAILNVINDNLPNDVSPFEQLTVNKNEQWVETFDYIIQTSLKYKENKVHVPVLSGPPGIGKTSLIRNTAEQYNLILIEIDASELYSEDLLGMPIPDDSTSDNIKVRFTPPKLHYHIERLIETGKNIKKDIIKRRTNNIDQVKTEMQQFESQRWKYLIFIDEINRVDDKTFNALRRVLLERNYGIYDSNGNLISLPEGSIVVAAMNPHSHGTDIQQLTTHFMDVIDIIPASPNWIATRKYIVNKLNKTTYSEISIKTAINVFELLIVDFADAVNYSVEQSTFYLKTDGDFTSSIYVSPRTYSDLLINLARRYEISLDDITEILDGVDTSSTDKQIITQRIYDILITQTVESIHDVIFLTLHSNDYDVEATLKLFESWLYLNKENLFEKYITITHEKDINQISLNEFTKELQQLIDIENPTTLIAESVHFINANELLSDTELQQLIINVMSNRITDFDTLCDLLKPQQVPSVKINKNGDIELATKTDKLSVVGRYFQALICGLSYHGFSNTRINAIANLIQTQLSELIDSKFYSYVGLDPQDKSSFDPSLSDDENVAVIISKIQNKMNEAHYWDFINEISNLLIAVEE